MPRAPYATVGRPLEWMGPSRITIASARSFSRYFAMAGTRLGELASSSPSRMTRTFQVGLSDDAASASSAAQIATIGALSSEADRA